MVISLSSHGDTKVAPRDTPMKPGMSASYQNDTKEINQSDAINSLPSVELFANANIVTTTKAPDEKKPVALSI